jgi:alkylation response protein AidB-like acyl-CoA dehydrogenase
VAAFALSEAEAGSDVAGIQCQARRDGDHYLIEGEKTWISNGGIADFYVVFARTSDPSAVSVETLRGTHDISAFIVDAAAPGLEVAERIDVVAPHPLARLRFNRVRVPVAQRLGEQGAGFKIAMATLDVFRTSVAAAALGFAQRAFDEAIAWARQRKMFGQTLADFQVTQSTLADMATQLDAARLLTYRAAWLRDQGRRITREAAMAKMTATESAQRIIDAAVQMHGGMGVRKGSVVESLYREIRALRIYEGATEVQRLIIAREMLKN